MDSGFPHSGKSESKGYLSTYIVIFLFCLNLCIIRASQAALVVKNLIANAGDIKDAGSVPGWGRSPGGGHDNPLQYSYLENPMDRRAWWATVHASQRVRHN